MQVIGIDPGLGGAIAAAYKGNFDVWDMPVLEVKQKRWVSAAMLADLLLDVRTKDTRVLLERVSARPGQGVSSMFNFGMGYGIVQGVVAALEMPLSFVTPQEWRKKMGVPKGKDGSRQRVLELHPEFASKLTRKRDHGRADALLIAIFGSQ